MRDDQCTRNRAFFCRGPTAMECPWDSFLLSSLKSFLLEGKDISSARPSKARPFQQYSIVMLFYCLVFNSFSHAVLVSVLKTDLKVKAIKKTLQKQIHYKGITVFVQACHFVSHNWLPMSSHLKLLSDVFCFSFHHLCYASLNLIFLLFFYPLCHTKENAIFSSFKCQKQTILLFLLLKGSKI